MLNKRKPEERKSTPEVKSIKVPIPTFPPTAMVYSVPKSQNSDSKKDEPETGQVDIVSAAIMAKVLEERERERSCVKHCDTCTCSKSIKIIHHNTHHSVSTQTGAYKENVCVKCNGSLETTSSLKIVKNLENNKNKNIPVYIHEHDSLQSHINNIAKVQPNNFLIDQRNDFIDTIKHSPSHSHIVNTRPPPTNTAVNNNNKPSCNVNSLSDTIKTNGLKLTHHHLCDKTVSTYETESRVSFDDKSSAKNSSSSSSLKGPRYCSMRLQTGSKNILLDNAHNNVAPVLYTKQVDKKKTDSIHKMQEKQCTESCSSNDVKSSIYSDNSSQNQRVAEWIENNMDITPSSCENSRSESLKNENLTPNIDPVKYAEMESNVKKFLFGESAFLHTVEIGKMKYQNYRETETTDVYQNNQSNSHTETEI